MYASLSLNELKKNTSLPQDLCDKPQKELPQVMCVSITPSYTSLTPE